MMVFEPSDQLFFFFPYFLIKAPCALILVILLSVFAFLVWVVFIFINRTSYEVCLRVRRQLICFHGISTSLS